MSTLEKIRSRTRKLKERTRISLIWEVAALFVLSAVVIGIIAFVSLRIISSTAVREQTRTQAAAVAAETESAIHDYPAYEWLLEYWHEHADEMDIEYDVTYQKGTRTAEKAALLTQRHPETALDYLDENDLKSFSSEDQKLYAEVAYSWFITRINAIKKAYSVDYLFAVVADENYKTQFFLLSAGDEEKPRGESYEEAYVLGTTVSVKDNEQQMNAMKNARAENGALALAGNYLDYYMYLGDVNGQEAFIGLTFSLQGLQAEIADLSGFWMVFTVLVQLMLALSCLALIQFFVLKPLKIVQKNIRTYRETKEAEAVLENLSQIRSSNEIGDLSVDVMEMITAIENHVRRIERITAEKERISTELSLASRIQANTLPNIFPPFPERKEFDVYAAMDPAKEVGGDFYDFFLIDDTHLAFLIADVSGKSISGALFMMSSMITIRNVVNAHPSPAKALEIVNRQICENNPEDMFVTVWLGVLDLETGELTAANAGHEYPYIRHPGRKYEMIRDRHGFVLGVIENVRYHEYTLKLEPGTQLFVYTDGLPEAASKDGTMFTTDRVFEVLNQNPDASVVDTLSNIRIAVDEFVKDADQFDDLTMLCMQYNGPQKQEEE